MIGFFSSSETFSFSSSSSTIAFASSAIFGRLAKISFWIIFESTCFCSLFFSFFCALIVSSSLRSTGLTGFSDIINSGSESSLLEASMILETETRTSSRTFSPFCTNTWASSSSEVISYDSLANSILTLASLPSPKYFLAFLRSYFKLACSQVSSLV